jgi:hypothetical protein
LFGEFISQTRLDQDSTGSYAGDPIAQELITKLSLHPAAVPHYTFMDGILRYKNKIWVGSDDQLHQQLI